MKLTLRPTSTLPVLFSDWLRPDSHFDRDFFDLRSSLFPGKSGMNVPSVNIKETSNEYTLEVAAPGLERKDFNIEVENQNLKISAEKEEKEGANGYSRKEYSFNSFTRSFSLPEDAREADIDAKYENGILIIHIPKAKETPVKPAHKIPVA